MDKLSNEVKRLSHRKTTKIIHSVANFEWLMNQRRNFDYQVNLLGKTSQAMPKVWFYGVVKIKKGNKLIHHPTECVFYGVLNLISIQIPVKLL